MGPAFSTDLEIHRFSSLLPPLYHPGPSHHHFFSMTAVALTCLCVSSLTPSATWSHPHYLQPVLNPDVSVMLLNRMWESVSPCLESCSSFCLSPSENLNSSDGLLGHTWSGPFWLYPLSLHPHSLHSSHTALPTVPQTPGITYLRCLSQLNNLPACMSFRNLMVNSPTSFKSLPRCIFLS